MCSGGIADEIRPGGRASVSGVVRLFGSFHEAVEQRIRRPHFDHSDALYFRFCCNRFISYVNVMVYCLNNLRISVEKRRDE
jgi:hypothetical protein